MSEAVAAIRAFNRFYTRRIGALDEAHLGEPFGLAESRVLYETAQAPEGLAPKVLAERAGLDPGFLSRILKRFEAQGLVGRAAAPEDRRSRRVTLTPAGHAAFDHLRTTADGAVEGMIGALSRDQVERLTAAMAQVRALLETAPAGETILRPHRVGDMGWVVARHAELYAREYGWGEKFEGLVAGVCADFLRNFDPGRERCWIAERDGVRLGSIFLVRGDHPGEAKLRLLLLEPAARGLGLGRRLVRECVAFAREAGYSAVVLWTQSILAAARAVYAAEGFDLVASAPHDEVGPTLVGETWRLDLAPASAAAPAP